MRFFLKAELIINPTIHHTRKEIDHDQYRKFSSGVDYPCGSWHRLVCLSRYQGNQSPACLGQLDCHLRNNDPVVLHVSDVPESQRRQRRMQRHQCCQHSGHPRPLHLDDKEEKGKFELQRVPEIFTLVCVGDHHPLGRAHQYEGHRNRSEHPDPDPDAYRLCRDVSEAVVRAEKH